ncbi:hypothetical protein [Geomonas oryzae]|uniref:hypothetical protein n=1 Tax=Geomonas oryzae TaxID=2364273 RepID=UPI00100B5E86|nr:hypothetical protein [Geomonas oryzae]
MEIYTFDARNIIVWNVIKSSFEMNPVEMHKEIIDAFEQTKEQLKKTGVSYDKFKNVLVPNKDKHEACFIFDSQRTVNSVSYGTEIFNHILPEIMKIQNAAVFYGDILCGHSRDVQIRMCTEFYNKINRTDRINFQHSRQYFAVYVNNLSARNIQIIDKSLENCVSYVGFADLTFSCFLKDVVASCIGQGFIKIGNKIFVSTPFDDIDNGHGYIPFDCDQYPVDIFGVEDIYFGSFLSYKIQRRYVDSDNEDQFWGLNAVTTTPTILAGYDIEIEDNKYDYLMQKKGGSLSITGLNAMTKNELIKVLKSQINTNYIFNISFSKEFDCLKFATLVEIYCGKIRRKYLAAFQVKKEKKTLRLISMY